MTNLAEGTIIYYVF